jgi:ribosomal protein S18 acetylase RimI-like enzyme
LTVSQQPTLRPARPDEAELLYRIYASTREAELAAVPWAPSAKEAFLRMQFSAQERHFRAVYPKANYDLIVSGDEVLGLLYVDRAAQVWLAIHLALLPQHRGKGLGTRLLTELLAQASAAARPVRLHVERFNPAQRLYDRLGFRLIADEGVYLLLEWRPTAAPQPPTLGPGPTTASAPYPNTTS